MVQYQRTMKYKLLILLCFISLSISVRTTPALATGKAHLTLTPNSGPPTSHVTANGSGFHPNQIVAIFFVKLEIGTAMTDGSGTFSTSSTIPGFASPGTVRITARQRGLSAYASFTVWMNWFMFGSDPQHTHDNPYENIVGTGNVGNLITDWTFTAITPLDSSPAVSNQMVYIGSNDGFVYAMSAYTGMLRWKAHVGLAYDSSPAVVNGLLYIDIGLHLYALNATSGRQVWVATLGGSQGTEISPVVAGGIVYISSDNNTIYALDAATGALIWSAQLGGYVPSTPAVANGILYVCAGDGKVYAFYAGTGSLLWTTLIGGTLYASPAVVNGLVYVTSYNGTFAALDAATGAVVWADALGQGSFGDSSPAVADMTVYVGVGNGIEAFNASTGALLWTAATGNTLVSSPAVANGVVYVGSTDSRVYAFDAGTGMRLWTAVTGSYIDTSPAVANGVLYIGSGDDKLYAYHLPGTSP